VDRSACLSARIDDRSVDDATRLRGRIETASRMSTGPSTAGRRSGSHDPPGGTGRPPRRAARPRGAVHRVHTMMTVMTE